MTAPLVYRTSSQPSVHTAPLTASTSVSTSAPSRPATAALLQSKPAESSLLTLEAERTRRAILIVQEDAAKLERTQQIASAAKQTGEWGGFSEYEIRYAERVMGRHDYKPWYE